METIMDKKKLEANIKSTEDKLEILENQRRELEAKVERQRTAVNILADLIEATKELDDKIS